MENKNIINDLEKITLYLEKGLIDCSKIHEKAGHTDHERCFVLGIDATPEAMCINGSRGSYFYVDNRGMVHQQYFIQGEEAHEWGKDNIVSTEYFLDYIKGLPSVNMANPQEVLSRMTSSPP